jgi:hypothetical protein
MKGTTSVNCVVETNCFQYLTIDWQLPEMAFSKLATLQKFKLLQNSTCSIFQTDK